VPIHRVLVALSLAASAETNVKSGGGMGRQQQNISLCNLLGCGVSEYFCPSIGVCTLSSPKGVDT